MTFLCKDPIEFAKKVSKQMADLDKTVCDPALMDESVKEMVRQMAVGSTITIQMRVTVESHSLIMGKSVTLPKPEQFRHAWRRNKLAQIVGNLTKEFSDTLFGD